MFQAHSQEHLCTHFLHPLRSPMPPQNRSSKQMITRCVSSSRAYSLFHDSTNNHYTIQLNTVTLSKEMLLWQFQKSTPNSEMNERIKRFFHHVHFINAVTGHWHSPPIGEFHQQQAKIPPSSANINSTANSGAGAHFFL